MPAVLTEPDLLELTVLGGLAGCSTGERYALVEVAPTSPLFRLCSLDEPGLDFLVAPPAVFFPDYAPEIDDTSAARLGLTDAADALLLVVLTVGDDLASSTANLMAPIVLHSGTRRAAQVIVEGTWPLRAPLLG
jgi:flagellar assembly factor FliW